MKLSVVVVAYEMAREIPRTLRSLVRDYQELPTDFDYEVIVVDNGSRRAPLEEREVARFGSEFSLCTLRDAPPSPARALNEGVRRSSGEIVCLMIDGAHMLTPGVIRLAMSAFRAFDYPVVATRYFYLGPGPQNETVLQGYCEQVEDGLLQQIGWPADGYRLFEIGTPLQHQMPKITWFNKIIESNCLFFPRSAFDRIDGADERFDLPGGGFLNIDLYTRLVTLPEAIPVQLIGEGSFHQVHGGTTTNVPAQERDSRVEQYKVQYEGLRGAGKLGTGAKDVFYIGHQPTLHSRIQLRNRDGGGGGALAAALRNEMLEQRPVAARSDG